MLDTNLIHAALTAFGISAGAAIVIAAAIIAGVALWRRRVAGGGHPAAAPARRGRAIRPARHEPALR